MTPHLQVMFLNDKKLHSYLKENSYWYKYLNRNEVYLKDFKYFIKKKYKLGTLDKLENGITAIDTISTFINNL